MPGPFLFCYDGSKGSRGALRSAGELMARPSDGFVLTVWQPASLRLAVAGTFAPAVLSDEEEIDDQERSYAERVAEEGAKLGRDHGYDLTPIVERAGQSIPHTIIETAARLDVSLIVCGQRGQGALRTALLGSVSHALVAHAARPILLAPEKD
ncbi:MAG TPA: universal stress protein [Acidimicrobiales bacterium]|nr:universal stress protein [Acidimicrobiales bacterium]